MCDLLVTPLQSHLFYFYFSQPSQLPEKGSSLFISISKCEKMGCREVSGLHCDHVGRSVDEGRFSFVCGICVYWTLNPGSPAC